jgi:hypothetical protein
MLSSLMEIVRNLWKDPVWSKVISSGLLVLIGWLTYQFEFVKGYIDFILIFFSRSLEIPLWVICALIVVLSGFGFRIISRWITSNSEISFYSYNTDILYGLVWRRDYTSIDQIMNLHSFCPQCDYQLKPQYNSTGFRPFDFFYSYDCDECSFKLNSRIEKIEEFEERVIKKIQQKIRNNEWKSVISNYKNDNLKNRVRKLW